MNFVMCPTHQGESEARQGHTAHKGVGKEWNDPLCSGTGCGLGRPNKSVWFDPSWQVHRLKHLIVSHDD